MRQNTPKAFLQLLLVTTALSVVVFSITFSSCTQQQSRQQDKSNNDYEELYKQLSAFTRQHNDSALMLLDSLEQQNTYPEELINVARGDIYSKTTETKKAVLSIRKAFTENLYKKWPHGYYRAGIMLECPRVRMG